MRWNPDFSAVGLGLPAGAVSSQPMDINNVGVVVANAFDATVGGNSRAMVRVDGVWMDLQRRLVNPAG